MTKDYFAQVALDRPDAPCQNINFFSSPESSSGSGLRSPWALERPSHAHDITQSLDDKYQMSPVPSSSSPQLANTFSEVSISKRSPQHTTTPRKPFQNPARVALDTQEPEMNGSVRPVLASELADLLQIHGANSILLLDMRTAANFGISRVKEAVNISVPATLLKRSAFTISRIIDGLSSSDDQQRLRAWTEKRFVAAYDSDSFHVGSGTALYQFVSKFSQTPAKTSLEAVFTIKGGFSAIMRDCPALVDQLPLSCEKDDKFCDSSTKSPSNKSKLSLKVFGGLTCVLPTKETTVNPFFNNIRQNQDLIGGVGDPIPMQIPPGIESMKSRLPLWLRMLVFEPDGPKRIAEKFLKIEKEEQARMQRVLNSGVTSGQDSQSVVDRHSIAAGVERGDKNRYNNIWPYENSRVRLQHLSSDANDYINASYLHVNDSDNYYIATQGPLPGTTRDFWQVVWENDVRVIVMLTKTVEEGQQKCHSYWDDSVKLQPYHLDLLDVEIKEGSCGFQDKSSFTVRKLSLSDTADSLVGARDITHIQFPDWPDLHVIGPDKILALLNEVHQAEENLDLPAAKRRKSVSSMTQGGRSNRPMICHCSAGCGRTGVFCTTDTVTNILRRTIRAEEDPDQQKIDLVEQVVREFRDQRLSMVQT